jgi:hypothetical protein
LSFSEFLFEKKLNRSKFRPPEPQLQRILFAILWGTSPYRAEIKLASLPDKRLAKLYNSLGAIFFCLNYFVAARKLRMQIKA